MSQNPDGQQQAWDYPEFVRCYNKIASEKGGYRYREDIADLEELRIEYLLMGLATIRDYALSTYQLEQQY